MSTLAILHFNQIISELHKKLRIINFLEWGFINYMVYLVYSTFDNAIDPLTKVVFDQPVIKFMNKQQKQWRTSKPTIFRKIARKRNYSSKNSNAYQDKYIIEGETKQIGQVISSKSSSNKTSIVTFKFADMPIQNFSHKMLISNRADIKKRNANKQIYLHSIRPLINNINLASLRVTSCEVRKLENEICNRKSYKRMNDDYNESLELEVQGVSKNMRSTFHQANFVRSTAVSTRNSKMRMTAGSFRVKSHQSNQLFPHSNSVELVEFLRRPSFKKDHFVFGLSDKTDTPDHRMEMFRDFLWKINYSNAIFVITPSEINSYKAFVGKGNNCIMIKSILRRRPWWTIVEQELEANFVWTQLKVNTFFETQPCRKMQFTLRDIYCESQANKFDLSTAKQAGVIEENNPYSKIFNQIDLKNWRLHEKQNIKTQQKICSSTYMKRVGLLNKKRLYKIENPCNLKVQNHLIQNFYIGNKKALFYNLKRYYDYINQSVFQVLPLTFHIAKGVEDPKFILFNKVYQQFQEEKKIDKELKNIWIIKPGENTNRGNGISICFSMDDIIVRLRSRQRNKDGSLRTFILQKYLEKPLLFNGRKFDIRHYVLITSFAGSMRGYWYQQGYVRTSSSAYSLKNNKDLFVHLTNDAIQKNGDNYGKYENGNKLSYEQLEKYILKVSKKEERPVNFIQQILPKMREIAANSIRSTYHLLDKSRKHHNFELLGLDFMIDDCYNPYLIEVNTNPCLELSCPLLESIIPQLIQNTLNLCIDPLFPPPEAIQVNKKTFAIDNHIQQNKYQLIFDELLQHPNLKELFEDGEKIKADLGNVEQDESQFQNDGAENWEQQKKGE